MKFDKVLKLGNPKLHEISSPVSKEELPSLQNVIQELRDILLEFRKEYGYGRAIASPQIGAMKRLVYMNIEGKETLIINPKLEKLSEETFELWDDCLCFPNLFVRVKRHKSCTLKFTNHKWEEEIWDLEDGMSELIQHEYDHLEGILATQRAVDNKSFKMMY